MMLSKQPSRTLVKQMFAELQPYRRDGNWWLRGPDKTLSPWGPYLSKSEMMKDREALAHAYAAIQCHEKRAKPNRSHNPSELL